MTKTRRFRTGGGYVPVVGGVDQYKATYEERPVRGLYVEVLGGPAQWQITVSVGGEGEGLLDESGEQLTDEAGNHLDDE